MGATTMAKTVLKIERLAHNKFIPEYKTEGAAGMDLCAAIEEPVTLKSLERALIPTGIKIECPFLFVMIYFIKNRKEAENENL